MSQDTFDRWLNLGEDHNRRRVPDRYFNHPNARRPYNQDNIYQLYEEDDISYTGPWIALAAYLRAFMDLNDMSDDCVRYLDRPNGDNVPDEMGPGWEYSDGGVQLWESCYNCAYPAWYKPVDSSEDDNLQTVEMVQYVAYLWINEVTGSIGITSSCDKTPIVVDSQNNAVSVGQTSVAYDSYGLWTPAFQPDDDGSEEVDDRYCEAFMEFYAANVRPIMLGHVSSLPQGINYPEWEDRDRD